MNHPSHLTTYDCDYCTGEMGWCDTCARVTYLDECEHGIEVPNEPQDEVPLRFWGGGGGMNLFEIPPYQDAMTSILAAESMQGKAEPLREQVYAALLAKPMTDEQIADTLGLAPNTARPRRVELARAGRIVETGTALTKSGRKAVLWRAV